MIFKSEFVDNIYCVTVLFFFCHQLDTRKNDWILLVWIPNKTQQPNIGKKLYKKRTDWT